MILSTQQYNLAGCQTRITWPDAFYAAYEYDVAGALTAVRENGATSGAGVLALYAYDDLGRRASVTRGNGVVTTYAYDSASRLDVLSHDLSGAGSDLALDFSYNSAGQILARDRTSANGAYVYPQPAPNADTNVSNGLNANAAYLADRDRSHRWCWSASHWGAREPRSLSALSDPRHR